MPPLTHRVILVFQAALGTLQWTPETLTFTLTFTCHLAGIMWSSYNSWLSPFYTCWRPLNIFSCFNRWPRVNHGYFVWVIIMTNCIFMDSEFIAKWQSYMWWRLEIEIILYLLNEETERLLLVMSFKYDHMWPGNEHLLFQSYLHIEHSLGIPGWVIPLA